MKTFGLFFVVLFASPLMTLSPEAETYYIGKDEGGIFFQTDQNGGWYIDEEDLKYFKIGEKGTYSLKVDRYGTCVINS